MQNCALYFGSFNPLHIGHIAIAKYVIQQPQIDSFSFVLSPQNPIKEDTGNAKQRLKSLQLTIKELNSGDFNFVMQKDLFNSAQDQIKFLEIISAPIPFNKKFSVSNIEFHLPKPLYTFNTLKKLQEENPNTNFIIIMGADNLNIIEKWYKGKQILQEFKIWVYPRDGYDTITLCKKYGATYLDAPQIKISSTQIREKLL